MGDDSFSNDRYADNSHGRDLDRRMRGEQQVEVIDFFARDRTRSEIRKDAQEAKEREASERASLKSRLASVHQQMDRFFGCDKK